MPRLVILLAPSRAACVELPRRVASRGVPLAGILPATLPDLAVAIAEPILLGQGLGSWDLGQAVLLAETVLDGPGAFSVPAEQPRAPFALALARTLETLRGARIDPPRLAALASSPSVAPEDRQRLEALSRSYAAYCTAVDGSFADRATLCRAAVERVRRGQWGADTEVVIADDLVLDPSERELLVAVTDRVRVQRIARAAPAGLEAGSFGSWCSAHGIPSAPCTDTCLAPLEASFPSLPAGLERLGRLLFEPPSGEPSAEGAVELLTAAGEAAEVRAIVRRLLREAGRGVPFEEMAVILPRAETYVPLLADLLGRISVPYRLHPSLPLASGRVARALLLLFACRGLERGAVMEFLTFAPVPFQELLGEGHVSEPSLWDALSREAGVVGGLERWIIGLRAHAEDLRAGAGNAPTEQRRALGLARADAAEALLRLVELLSATLDGLAGEASWAEWSQRLGEVLRHWIAAEAGADEPAEHEAVADVLADLALLGPPSRRVPWDLVERVLAGRLAGERLPLAASTTGAVHVGSMDALAGVPFRVVAVPGLVEGGYPGVLRQDPFLLDAEREALSGAPAPAATRARPSGPRQLSLFDDTPPEPAGVMSAAGDGIPDLPTTRDRLAMERRAFHRAVRQARERLILSYPRADARTGRERLPSLFFVAAATACQGRMLSAAELEALVHEDALETLALDEAVDRVERDRARLRRDPSAAAAVAAGAPFLAQARRLARARWSRRLTAFDGFVGELPSDLGSKLDPAGAERPVSASRLSTFARCGFLYLLRYVLRLEPRPRPAERLRLEALERGNLFHDVAERFLRARRDAGELPLRDVPEMRTALRSAADAALDAFVASSPPRYAALWEVERQRFHTLVAAWLERELRSAARAKPIHFEVSFGQARPPATREPHLEEPLSIELSAGRSLHLEGRIDRVDERPDGALILRDYKTGRAPRAGGQSFRAGVELQIPIYLLAAARIFPGRRLAEAFLDYVDGGRPVHVEIESEWEARLRLLLAEMADAMAGGVFPQEPSACSTCDFTAVCGPAPLIELQQREKRADPQLARLSRLREGV